MFAVIAKDPTFHIDCPESIIPDNYPFAYDIVAGRIVDHGNDADFLSAARSELPNAHR